MSPSLGKERKHPQTPSVQRGSKITKFCKASTPFPAFLTVAGGEEAQGITAASAAKTKSQGWTQYSYNGFLTNCR